MDVSDLFRIARQEVKRQIASNQITQSELARKSGISQPTLSAYLKDDGAGEPFKNLRPARINALWRALDLSVEELVEAQKPPIQSKQRFIPRVSEKTAIRRRRISLSLIEGETGITYATAEQGARKDLSEKTFRWDRFVAVKATADHARFMYPVIRMQSTLIIDRFDLELRPPLKTPVIYALSDGDNLKIGYLEVVGVQLELLPDANGETPILVKLGYRGDESRIIGTVIAIVHQPQRKSWPRRKVKPASP